MSSILARFHPKFKGAVSGSAIGAGIVAVLGGLGAHLTTGEANLVVLIATSVVTYLAPGSAHSN